MNNLFKKNYSYNQLLEFFILSILLIFPKFNIIDIPNYHQGIRIEDLLIVYIAFFLILSNSFEIKKNDFGFNFIIFFFILLISIIHGSFYFSQKWVILPRYLEYIVLLIYFNRFNPNLSLIFTIIRLYLILNFFAVILQELGLFGEISSLGYESPSNLSDDRPTGLTGGPWELSNCSAIIFFTLLLDKKQSLTSKYFFSIIAIYLIFATQSRAIVISFFLALAIYIYMKNLKLSKFYFFLIFLVTTILCFLLIIKFADNFLIFDEVYFQLIPMMQDFIFYQEKTNLDDLDGRLWSMAYRIDHWLEMYNNFLLNPFTIIFGSGSTTMYYESIIFRILFGVGIFGFIFVLFAVRTFPLHIFVLLFITGLTLDLLLSFKIFLTILFYFYILMRLRNDTRD